MPFWGPVKIKKQVPLHLVIDIIIEQGIKAFHFRLNGKNQKLEIIPVGV